MKRITEADLRGVVARINRITNSPDESYTKRKDGKYYANVGNYHLDHAYGGVALYRMMSVNGGIEDVLQCGHVSKRELYHMMHAYIRGMEKYL